MYKFSKRSLDNLVGVHPDLVKIVHDVMDLQIMDFSVVDGLRTEQEQRVLVRKGFSKTMNSKHLKQSTGFSHAVDLYPYPVDFNDKGRFGLLGGLMLATAKSNGVILRWGADWDSDGQIKDHSFVDMPHFEIIL